VNEPVQAYPLQWPAGVPRSSYRQDSQFAQTVATARKGLDAVKVTETFLISQITPEQRAVLENGLSGTFWGDDDLARGEASEEASEETA
jgi:hypothetical protein